MSEPTQSSAPRRLGLLAAWLVLAATLLVSVPLFLCSPLWVDATLYDLCARNLLEGGVHYRDTFDTNPPGMTWLHTLVRGLLGWRPETLRLIDLMFVGGAILLLVQFVDTTGRPAARVWTAMWMLAFYFSLPEVCHCQRDFWMLLPACAGLVLRRGQTQRLMAVDTLGKRAFLWSVLEGTLWAAGIWIKPFVLVPCLLCWLVSVALARRHGGTPWRRLILDGVGMLLGGLLVGGAGFAWLVATGAWPYFREILFEWNPEYLARANQFEVRVKGPLYVLVGTWPWSLVVLFAVPLAVVLLVRAFRSADSPGPVAAPRTSQALVAAFTLGWLVQAMLLQHPQNYVLTPVVLPALALIAAWGGLPGRTWAGWLAVAAFAFLVLVSPVRLREPRAFFAANHPMLQWNRLELWPRCVTEGATPELRDRLALNEGIGRVHWQDLERVADFLRERGVKDGEVTCFHNSTHPLYLELGIAPSTRYFHFTTVMNAFPDRRRQIEREIHASGHRYVVSDLEALVDEGGKPERPLAKFPWNQPVLFRAGRYQVHEVRRP